LLLPGPVPWEWFCPEVSRCSRTSSISWAGSTPSRTEGREPTRSGSLLRHRRPGYRSPLFCLFRSVTYPPRPSAPSSSQVAAAISRLAFLPILQTPLYITREGIVSARLPAYRELQLRLGHLTSATRCMSWAAEEPRQIRPTKWISMTRFLALGQRVCRSPLPGATSRRTPTVLPEYGCQAVTEPTVLLSWTRWKSSVAP
jgi:hypothetical protein